MSKRTTNIQDVAAAAGVSVATVSRTLQLPDRVTATTQRRVRAAIESLNYTPNAQARNLRRSRTGLVVALVPDIANPFFSGIIRGIEAVANLNGYSVLLGDTQYEAAKEQRYGDMISAREADGLITLLPHIPRISVRGRPPVVNACETIGDGTVSTVTVDNFAAARHAIVYLLTLGHRMIAFVGGPPDSPVNIERRRGFNAALSSADIAPDPHLCVDGNFSLVCGVRAADLILSYQRGVTAFVCASDELAIGVMRALLVRGIAVPAEVSVMGFDDIAVARYMEPPLTTVAQPREDMGREAMLMLLQILADPDTPIRRSVLPTQLIVRDSTAAPPALIDRHRAEASPALAP